MLRTMRTALSMLPAVVMAAEPTEPPPPEAPEGAEKAAVPAAVPPASVGPLEVLPPAAPSLAPPEIELAPYTPAELWKWFRGGEPYADRCEKLLTWATRARGALDLALAEGLEALRRGDRLAELCYHLDDYGREVLDLGR